MKKSSYPKITFGIIVLNGEPFIRYCLKSLYPYAHEIIVVEGGHEDAHAVCTPDGHSVDGTLETLYRFKNEEDPENKLTVVTRQGFWPKKDEMGRNRTPQSRAYAEIATGDYLWQIDSDEFYKGEDLISIMEMLKENPDITAVTFPTYTFWGDINYTADSWALRRGAKDYHRLFKWAPNYKYLTHEPPTVVDENGIDLRTKHWVNARILQKRGIYMYHYSLLFPWQVEQKTKVYANEDPDGYGGIVKWAENNYFKIGNPYRVHNIYDSPSWLNRFKGKHPQQIYVMMNDVKSGLVTAKLRQTDDIEVLLKSFRYKFKILLLIIADPLDTIGSQLIRVKNIPNRIRKMLK